MIIASLTALDDVRRRLRYRNFLVLINWNLEKVVIRTTSRLFKYILKSKWFRGNQPINCLKVAIRFSGSWEDRVGCGS